MRYLLPLSAAILLAVMTSSSLAGESDGPALEGLGDGLFDDNLLDKDLLEELMQEPPTVPPAAKPNIPDGEDLGQEESPLQKIERSMKNAGELIRLQNATETRQVQQGIITELDRLIDKLNKQCQSCSSTQCKKPSQQQTQKQSPKQGQSSGSSSATAQAAATESQATEGQNLEGEELDDARGDSTGSQLVKQLWGQLPERMRQQLLQSSADEFLPKYRKQLEQYYRRLAEEQSNAKPNP